MNIISQKPICTFGEISVRYASSTQRMYLESAFPGKRSNACVTLDDVIEKFPSGPLSKTSPGVYYLEEDLYILDGVTLNIKDSELLLKSDSESFLNVRAHGGSLSIENSNVTSWDSSKNGPDENIEDGRSYLSAISEVITDPKLLCDGQAKNTMGEARLDISDSEISYLGYFASESWGITMKVRGLCKDKSNPEVMDLVSVRGNIIDSEIHHMYHGHYSYGHVNGEWSRNIIHDNIGYSLDPHDYSRNATIEDNTVFNNGIHGIIGSKWCTDLHIRRNTVYNSKVGIFLHKNSDRAIVEDNVVYDNRDSGIVFLESTDAVIRGNTVYNNVIGTRLSGGSRDLLFEGNTFENNGELEVYMYTGSDDLVELDSKSPQKILFSNNVITGDAIRLTDSESIQFVGNQIELDVDIAIEESSQILFLDNIMTLPDVRISGDTCFNTLSDFGDPLCNTDEGVLVETTEPVVLPTTVPVVLPTIEPTFKTTTMEISFTFAPTSSPTSSPTTENEIPSTDRGFDDTSSSGVVRIGFMGMVVTGLVSLIVI